VTRSKKRKSRAHGAATAAALSGSIFGAIALVQPIGAQETPQGNEPAASEVETIIVTGQRAALESAQAIKKNSDEIVDSIVAEDIGKLPDRSVTEVLQRVVGVTIDHTYRDIGGNTDPEHFAVEGAGVTIRGLSYVRSEINGRDSFTANGGRSLSFDDVPPELMAAVDVYKNPSAEQIEGAIGGLVNLRTAMPLDFDGMKISGSAMGTYGELSSGNVKPSASLLFSDRWQVGDGDFGVLVDIAHSESATRTDGVELEAFFPRVSSLEPEETWIPAGQTMWVPRGGVSWRTLAYERKRDGAYAALQWKPSDDLQTSLTFFRSQHKFHWDENAIFTAANGFNVRPAPGTSFTFDSQNRMVSGVFTDPDENGLPFNDDVRSANRKSVTTDVSWNLKWDVSDKLGLSTDLQYIRSTTDADDLTIATGVNVPSETVMLTGNPPSASVDPAFLTDPANYYWAFTMDGLSKSAGKEYSWRADADYAIGDGFFKSIRGGIRATDRSAETAVTVPGNGYNWQPVSQTWMLGWYMPRLAGLNEFPGSTSTYAFPRFFNGREDLPSAVVFPAASLTAGWPNSFQQIQQFRDTLCHEMSPNSTCAPFSPWIPPAFDTVNKRGMNDQDERTYSAYINLKFGADLGSVPFDGNLGVRVVRSENQAHGYFSLRALDLGNTQIPTGHVASEYVGFTGFDDPLTEETQYTDVLPSLNLRFKLTEQLQARLAVAKALSRPDFSQLQAATGLQSDLGNQSGIQTFTGSSSGNPTLKPTKSTQIDATLEWYFAPTSSITAAVFYKDLHDVVVNQLFYVPVTDTSGGTQTFSVNGPINGADGTIQGFELAYQQYFDFLPSFLKGFGLQANYTYVDSERELYDPVSGAYCESPNPQQASLNLNFNGCDTDGRTFGDLPLQGLSKHSYNVSLLYDRGPISGRLAYSWREAYLMGVNVNGTNGGGLNTNPDSPNYGQGISFGLPTYADDYGQLDGSLFWKINDTFTFGVEAQNLTDSTYKELQKQHIGTMGRAWFVTGRRYTAQFRVTF
jgi:iron complex outermembrane receptor protein